MVNRAQYVLLNTTCVISASPKRAIDKFGNTNFQTYKTHMKLSWLQYKQISSLANI
jgi:hypothetical protein